MAGIHRDILTEIGTSTIWSGAERRENSAALPRTRPVRRVGLLVSRSHVRRYLNVLEFGANGGRRRLVVTHSRRAHGIAVGPKGGGNVSVSRGWKCGSDSTDMARMAAGNSDGWHMGAFFAEEAVVVDAATRAACQRSGTPSENSGGG